MSCELPSVVAALSRLPHPKENLAAFGGVAFPIAFIIEAPIIMLLSASTTLCRDLHSYVLVRGYMVKMALALTVLHALLAFTSLFEIVFTGIIGAPAELRDATRMSLMILLPWTGAIAYRRFKQGVLIRMNFSRHVSIGTGCRLTGLIIGLVGLSLLGFSGAVVGPGGIILGVVAESIYSGVAANLWAVPKLREEPLQSPLLTAKAFLHFYLPLAIMAVLYFILQPIGSAALARMPSAIDSLAAWPAVTGLLFLFRSTAFALSEVVVAHMDHPEDRPALARFSLLLGGTTMTLLGIFSLSPLAYYWFSSVGGLEPALAHFAATSLYFAIPLPGLAVLQSFSQGHILHLRQTRHITVAVVLYLAISCLILAGGVFFPVLPGLYFAQIAAVAGTAAQALWLFGKARIRSKN